MLLRQIYDPDLSQYDYLIGCEKTREAIVIDPERDVDRYLAIAAGEGLKLNAVAETHIHADFVSGARELARDPATRVYLSAEGGPDWQSEWARNRANVTLLRDGDTFKVGNIRFQALHTPGHTPAHLAYLVTTEGGGAKPERAFYVARMKNVTGGVLGELGKMPEPRRLTIDEVTEQLDNPNLVVLDTRADRAAFMKAHLRGSLYAPAKGSFSDFAGSFLGPDERIVLVVDSADQVEEQVRRLIRIGFDKIEGWLSVAALASTNRTFASIPSGEFRE